MTNKTILLVEDNTFDQELTVRAFAKNKIANDIVIVNDGVEALDYLYGTGKYAERDLHHLPSLILLDLKLPRIDGLEVLKKIRSEESTKLVPVVILTSSKEEQDIIRGYSLGVNSYIIKPVDFENFSDAIHQLGLYWLILNIPPI